MLNKHIVGDEIYFDSYYNCVYEDFYIISFVVCVRGSEGVAAKGEYVVCQKFQARSGGSGGRGDCFISVEEITCIIKYIIVIIIREKVHIFPWPSRLHNIPSRLL